MKDFEFIYDKLFAYYGPQGWWPAETSFEMMIGAILVQNTSWRNVEKALEKARPFLTPEAMEELAVDDLAELIRSSGFFNVKAKRIKSFLEWFKGYQYDVELVKRLDKQRLRKELLGINGIGAETADVMLVYAFDTPVFVVDAYARRIFSRFGFDVPANYETFRQMAEAALPYDLVLFNEYHALLVEHAKVHCQSDPICEGCPLALECLSSKVND